MPFIARTCLTSAIGIVLVAGTLGAQQFPRNAKVDRIFAQWDKAGSPGCAVGVVQNGKFVYQRGYGMANLDYDIPNSPRMVYYIGSDSKQFTAASIALLAMDGKISLDDDIRKYFPEMPDYGTPITVHHLVHHTSGIRDIYGLMSLGGLRMEDVFTDSQAVALIARQKELNFKPGDDYLYSNSGYFLLGQLVKRVTGKSLREFADERIFQPLGMTKTHFHDDPGHVMKQRAMSYEQEPSGAYRISYLQNFDKIGAGGLYSTVEDLKKWDDNYYAPKVGGDAMLKLVRTRGVLNKGDTLPYAFGNNVTSYRGLRVDEHGGSLMGYKAEILRFPDERFTVLATCNLGSINPGPLAQQVAEVYLGGKMGPAQERIAAGPPRRQGNVTPAGSAISAADLSSFMGNYYSEEVDATYQIRMSGDHLVLTSRLGPGLSLVPTGTDMFRAGSMTLKFERNAQAAPPSAFTVEAGRVRNIRFVRR